MGPYLHNKFMLLGYKTFMLPLTAIIYSKQQPLCNKYLSTITDIMNWQSEEKEGIFFLIPMKEGVPILVLMIFSRIILDILNSVNTTAATQQYLEYWKG